MKTNSETQTRKISLGAAICFALLLVIISPQAANAQLQWTNSTSNPNDIHNINTGNVGVGTTTPAYKFDALASAAIIARFSSTAAAHNQVLLNAPSGFNANLTFQQAAISKWFLGNRAADNRFSFMESTGTIEVFTLLQNGNVGIGTASPASPLHLATSGTVSELFRIESNTNNSNVVIGLKDNSPGQTRAMAFNFTNSSDLAQGQIAFFMRLQQASTCGSIRPAQKG